MVETGRELDVAIQGEGFFTVATAGGEAYTRGGQFDVAADGKTVYATIENCNPRAAEAAAAKTATIAAFERRKPARKPLPERRSSEAGNRSTMQAWLRTASISVSGSELGRIVTHYPLSIAKARAQGSGDGANFEGTPDVCEWSRGFYP